MKENIINSTDAITTNKDEIVEKNLEAESGRKVRRKKIKKRILIFLIVFFSILMIAICFSLYVLLTVKSDAAQLKNEYLPAPVSILIIGVDGGAEDFANDKPLYTDVMMGLSYNPVTNVFQMLSIPRDAYMQIPCKYEDEFGSIGEKLNSAYMYGTYSDGNGMECLMNTLESNLGLKFSDYFLVDFESMSNVSNELGPIEIKMINGTKDLVFCASNRFGVSDAFCYQEGQTRQMQGEELLAYVRHRKTDSTVYRELRQQQVVEGYMMKVASMFVTGEEEKFRAAFSHIDTSLSYDQVKALIYQASSFPSLAKAQIITTSLVNVTMPNSQLVEKNQDNLDIIYRYMTNFIPKGFEFSFDGVVYYTENDIR